MTNTGSTPALLAHERLSDDDFRQALGRVAPHLRAFARSLSGCRERADDLAQDTMLRAWAARDRYQAGTNFKAWTFTILRNRFYSEARRDRFHGEYDELAAERILQAPASQDQAVELADVLRALTALPASHREALILVAAGIGEKNLQAFHLSNYFLLLIVGWLVDQKPPLQTIEEQEHVAGVD